ncbi:MAG: hypothetical protein J6R40_02360 [Clostridia bacterium]|nr:hypothetical protein [Clostridia bacterium]
MGALGGFPLGAKTVCLAYENGELTKREAEHLLGFVNVTGPAFLVAGVGAALRGNAAEGFIFYSIQILSALLAGALTAPKKRRLEAHSLFETEPFSIAASLANNTAGMLSICGTIVFFSAVASLLCVVLPENISVFLLAFLEITTGVDAIAGTLGTAGWLSFSLTCAAVCFGGVCVGVQSAVFAKKAKLSMKSYFKGKILCAVFGFLFGLLWCALVRA